MAEQHIEVQIAQGVAVLWLNRTEVRNALNAAMVGELTAALKTLDRDAGVRAVVLAGRGPAFCAGGDLAASLRLGRGPTAANTRDARALATLFHRLHTLSKPTLARVHGAAFAGGVGLIAACDIAIASQEAEFCLSEVKVGMAAASIVPYLLRAMGERATRRYVLSAEVFSAAEAYRIGLVHELALPPALDEMVDTILTRLIKGGPAAQATAKRLISSFSGRPLNAAAVEETVRQYTRLRVSAEAQEGMAAFLDKRPPAWQLEDGATAAPKKKATRSKRA